MINIDIYYVDYMQIQLYYDWKQGRLAEMRDKIMTVKGSKELYVL